MSWTDERVETLKRMWSEGQSASAIAKELGGVTRNAVIGKVHRLGLSNRNDEPEPAPAPAPEPVAEKKADRKPAPAAQAAPRPEPQQPSEPAAPAREAPAEEEPVSQPVFTPANEISPETLASVREVEKRAKKLTLMELTERTCKWPIGDPATDKFWFCGLPSQAGKPYCDAHVSVAFQPMSSRRDRRR